MGRIKKWTENDLRNAVKQSSSIRQTLSKLGLIEAGGNYSQIKKYIKNYEIDVSHFLGKKANKGRKFNRFKQPISCLLIENSTYQSHKLKIRLFREGLKKPCCEICGWAKKAEDGRIPIELDHVNGIHSDNRIENLRILCPNCHSLQSTHRGRNKKMLG